MADDMKQHRYSDAAFSLYEFLDVCDCERLIALSEQKGFEAATINDGLTQNKSPTVRNNSRVIFDDKKLATDMWGRLHPFVPKELDGWLPVRLNERFRFYKYD